jgi:hypothetical protein
VAVRPDGGVSDPEAVREGVERFRVVGTVYDHSCPRQ